MLLSLPILGVASIAIWLLSAAYPIDEQTARASLGGAMAAVVRNTPQLIAEYRAAIAEYLKSLP